MRIVISGKNAHKRYLKRRENLANNIEVLRKDYGYSKSDLSKLAGINPSTYLKITNVERQNAERKNRPIPFEAICNIAEIFGVTIDELTYNEFKSDGSMIESILTD